MATAKYPYTCSVAAIKSGPREAYGVDVLFKGKTHHLPSLIHPEHDRVTFYSKKSAQMMVDRLNESREGIATYFPVLA